MKVKGSSLFFLTTLTVSKIHNHPAKTQNDGQRAGQRASLEGRNGCCFRLRPFFRLILNYPVVGSYIRHRSCFHLTHILPNVALLSSNLLG